MHDPFMHDPFMHDPFTMEFPLCDADGIVRKGAMHHGTDYICTSHAHFGGEHIRCTTPFHEGTIDSAVDGRTVQVPAVVLAKASALGQPAPPQPN